MAVPSSPTVEQRMEKQKKRSRSPGVRVVGGRIYDSKNGKTCHQCRQKTLDFTARCKNMKMDKQCTIMFCVKCLINRYGEKAEEIAVLDDWKCPRCRDICNCSLCMKKKGHKPTGILVHAAKATGFSSVSELLVVKGPDRCQELAVKNKTSSPKKSASLPKKSATSGKENSFNGTCNGNANSKADPDKKKAKKAKREELKERVEVPQANGVLNTPQKDNKGDALRRSPRKFNLPPHVTMKEDKVDEETANAPRRSPRRSNAPQVVNKKEENIDVDNCSVPSVPVMAAANKEKKAKSKNDRINENASLCDEVEEVTLPPGSSLTNVAGVDLVPNDIGYALQFLEFCSTFGEVLGIKKGQPESVLRDIMSGRSTRRGKYSSSVQFLIQLLSFMFKEGTEEESPSLSLADGKSSWIHSLKRCLSESELELEDLPENCFDKGSIGYEMLEASQKLRLLTFLCDETLSTAEMRNWIEDQNLKFVEQVKEAKESVNALKEKERLVKRKLQDEVAKKVIAKKGVPLSVSDYESIVSEIEAESKRVQEETLEAMGMVPKSRHADAVRTEPFILDDTERAFWILKCLADVSMLLQDMGAIEQVATNDKWFSFDEEEMKVVEKYTASVRLKRHRSSKLADQTMTKRSKSDPEEDSPASME